MNEYLKIPNIFNREHYGKNRIIEGDFSSPELEYLRNCSWEFTEKIDGTNIRVMWDGYRVSFAGRTEKAQIPKPLLEKLEELFGGESKEELFEEKFGNKTVILFGEGYGKGIQKHGELYGRVDFILFDVLIDKYWLSRENVLDIADTFEIKAVPFVFIGTLYQGVEFIKGHPKSKLRDFEMEGIVGRPTTPIYNRDGKPMIVKIKCRDFPEDRI